MDCKLKGIRNVIKIVSTIYMQVFQVVDKFHGLYTHDICPSNKSYAFTFFVKDEGISSLFRAYSTQHDLTCEMPTHPTICLPTTIFIFT